ncbi:Uncharacterised protein [Candidatus Burarchaeum australiense]|nr:Uncharacterised protein [Candidatus Burarchaeum australiense]
MPALRVLKDDRTVYESDEAGLKPLAHLYFTKPALMKGASIYDKVVGEAAARIFIMARVGNVHAGIASRGAFELLKKAGIPACAEKIVDKILNAARTGPCPMEKLSAENKDDEKFLAALKEKMRLAC